MKGTGKCTCPLHHTPPETADLKLTSLQRGFTRSVEMPPSLGVSLLCTSPNNLPQKEGCISISPNLLKASLPILS